ncbi:MAG: hypothetical protein PVH19_15505 [Planctomycetia bacterium]|jgi:hypothetical protein
MNYQVLRNEIESHPEVYADKTPEEIAAILNTADRQVLRQRWVSARTLYNELDDAEEILTRLEAAAANQNVPEAVRKMLSRVLGWLDNPSGQYPGIDIGSAKTQLIVDGLVGILTADQVTAIKSLGYRTVSRAEELGLGAVLSGHIVKATAEVAS